MTSFIAWLGADSRGPTSLYFASDSRLSWGNIKPTWDTGIKLFASTVSAEIMGFTGYTLLPTTILNKACEIINQNLRGENDSMNCESRKMWLYRIIDKEIKNHPGKPNLKGTNFSILYGMRIGEGMADKSRFCLAYYYWDETKKTLDCSDIEIPQNSSILKIDGSGKTSVTTWKDRWQKSDQGNTSRTMFSAFCHSLENGADPNSGGEPQLLGIYRKGKSKVFGIFTKNGPSFRGNLYPEIDTSKIEWRDTLFQRVDPTGALIKNAQRHSIPKRIQEILLTNHPSNE